MALIQRKSDKKDDAIFVKFAPKTGAFVQSVSAETEGAIARTTKATDEHPEGQLVHELHFPGITGQVSGLSVKKDEKYGGVDVNIAFKEPGQPTVIAGLRLESESGVSRSVVQLLQVLDKANLREMLSVGIGHKVDPAGSTFKQDGVDVVREKDKIDNTFFVAPLSDRAAWIRADFTAIPKAEPITDKAGKVVARDSSDLSAYASTLIESIQGKLEAIRLEDKAALSNAPAADAAEFGHGAPAEAEAASSFDVPK